MRQYFKPDEIVPDVPGILLLSHGGFAVGCLETIHMLMGEVPNLAAFSLEEGMEPEEFAKAAFDAYKQLPEGSIILVDLQGGTPYNQTLLFSRTTDEPINSVAGFNVPMVIQAIELRDEYKGRELVENLIGLNDNGVHNVSEDIDKLRAFK
jgi:PTS system mannose-specific IIA component